MFVIFKSTSRTSLLWVVQVHSPGPIHFEMSHNYWSWKKGFCQKIFYLCVLWTCKLFDRKYRYFTTFDQQISAVCKRIFFMKFFNSWHACKFNIFFKSVDFVLHQEVQTVSSSSTSVFQILSSISIFALLLPRLSFQVNKACWKSPKCNRRILVHFEKWVWRADFESFLKGMFWCVKWAKPNAFSCIYLLR